MMFDHDKVSIDADGHHHRGSVTLALVGDMRVPITWAVNAMSIHFPVNAERGLSVYPHMNLETAQNLAVETWLRAHPIKSEHLFIWPAGVPLAWDGIARAMEIPSNLDLGDGMFCMRRDLTPMTGPWFGTHGYHRMGYKVVKLDIKSQEIQLAPSLPESTVDPRVLLCVGIPSLGHTSLVWTSHALQLQGPVASIKHLAVMIGYEVGIARQRIVDAVLRQSPRPEYLLFLGDDNIPPYSGLQMLMETMRKTDRQAVCGLYHMKTGMEPPQPLAWRSDIPGLLIAGKDFRIGDTVEVDGTGLDFALIRTSALEKMIEKEGRPLFKTGLEHVPGRGVMIHTEDSFFWERYVRVIGERPLIDTRCLIGHYDAVSGAVY